MVEQRGQVHPRSWLRERARVHVRLGGRVGARRPLPRTCDDPYFSRMAMHLASEGDHLAGQCRPERLLAMSAMRACQPGGPCACSQSIWHACLLAPRRLMPSARRALADLGRKAIAVAGGLIAYLNVDAQDGCVGSTRGALRSAKLPTAKGGAWNSVKFA